MNRSKAHRQYLSNQLQTADSAQLIVLLYEAALRCVNIALDNMHYKTYDVVNKNLIKAMEIVNELRASLNMKVGGELARRLDAIYDYIVKELAKANLEKSKETLSQIATILNDLLGSWKTIASESANQKSPSPKKPSAYNSGFSITG